jgi:hypothetical protein
MRSVLVLGILLLTAGSAALAQAPDAGAGVDTGICVTPTYMGGDGKPHPCSSAPAAPSVPSTNPATQAAMNTLSDASYQLGYKLGQWLFGGNSTNTNNAAAAAAAAEAEREQQAAIARQQAIEEQRRQAIFNRLSQELKLSGLADLSLKGFDNNPGLQLKGFGDTSSNSDSNLQLKGLDGFETSNNAAAPSTPLGPQTCFFGDCGPQDPGLQEQIEPWNDPKVVDLRDLQQGVDLATIATKAPPADRQTIMDQALDAANGDQSVQVTIPNDNAVSVTNEQGLLAFQQANNAYRLAHNDAYQLQQTWQQDQQRDQAAYAIATQSEQQLESDIQQNMDQLTLEQKQQAMAQIFDAALEQELQYGRTWAQYLAARQKYFQDRYDLQMYLWNTALGKQGNPPAPPKQLTEPAPLPGPPNSDLSLVLPPVQPAVKPTKDDLSFLQQLQTLDSAQPLDPLTGRVLSDLQREEAQEAVSDAINDRVTEGASSSIERQDEADKLLTNLQQPLVLPPNLENQYRSNQQFKQQMDAEHQTIVAAQQQGEETAVQETDQEWQQKLSQLHQRWPTQPGVSLAQQAQTNPQLAAQLTAADKQVTANLVYKVMQLEYQTQRQWQQWVEQQESTLKPPAMSTTSAARE